MFKVQKETILIGSLAVLKLLIHIFTNTNYELHRDAFLYYSLGKHLDWGFVSVPPLIAVISKLSVFLFGETIFALRFFPALVGSISVIIISKIVRELKGGMLAIFVSSTAFILSPAFLRSNSLFQPVSFNQFFWLLSAYFIILLLKTRDTRYWIHLFLTFALAFYNKYSIVFFFTAFLISLALLPNRRLFISRNFLLGAIIALGIITPNIIWQFNHAWPVATHLSELQKTQFVNVSLTGFFVDQLVMNISGIVVWLTGLFAFIFSKRDKQFKIFPLVYLFTTLIILGLHGKSYYTLGLYSILFALGGVAIERYFPRPLIYISLTINIIIIVPLLPLSIPIYSHEKIAEYTKPMAEATNRWDDGAIHNLPQDYADMIAWKDLADIVEQAFHSLPDEKKKNCKIYAEQYGSAGAILFYCNSHTIPEPISFSDNFLLWAPDSISPETFIYVNTEIDDLHQLFDNIRIYGKIENEYFRDNGLKVAICEKPKDIFLNFYAAKVAELKRKYRR